MHAVFVCGSTIPVLYWYSTVLYWFSTIGSTEPILIFEYIQRGNLTENLRRGPADVIKSCLSILSGLEYLHHELRTSGKREPGEHY